MLTPGVRKARRGFLKHILQIDSVAVLVRSTADEKAKIYTRIISLHCVTANLENEKINCRLSVNN